MLTGLRIHSTRDGFKLADAREDYSSGDLLADIVQDTYPGGSTRKWALKDGKTGKMLQPNLTLAENEVGNDHDLHLVLKAGATQDVELDICAPDGKSLQCEIPSSLRVSAFLAKLVQHFDLAEEDSNGRPQQWVLVYASDQQALDPALSLIDNGIVFKDRLLIRPMSDPGMLVELISPDGTTKSLTYRSDRLLGEILQDVLDQCELLPKTAGGVPIDWQVYNRRLGRRLDPAKSLTENAVASGDQLAVERVEEPCLSFTVQVPEGESRTFKVPVTKATDELILEVIESFGLPRLNKRGAPQNWSLVDRENRKTLEPGRRLDLNGVKTGATLFLILEHSDLKLKITSPTKETRVAEEPADTATDRLLRDLIVAFRLEKRNTNGRLIPWTLCRKDNGKPIDAKKTLNENGLVDGDELLIRQETMLLKMEEGIQRGKGEGEALSVRLLSWLKGHLLPLIVGSIALVGVVILALILHFLHRLPPPATVRVHLLPNSSTLSSGESVRLHSEVTGGSSGRLIWSLAPQVGSLGPDLVYSAPSSVFSRQSVRLTATSVDDSTKFDTATITLLPSSVPMVPPVVLDPSEIKLRPAETVQLQATLRADVGSTVQWTLDPDVGTITSTGLYSAPAYLASPQTVTVTASSLGSPQSFAKAIISLGSSSASRIAPGNVTLNASQSSQFRLAPKPEGAVVWQVHPPVGSISSTGLYTAPSLVPQGVRLAVTAIPASSASAGGGSTGALNAFATINLQPVAMGAITYTAMPNHQYLFRIAVMNAVNPGVLWSIEPKFGSISADGVYTAPEVQSSRTITINAISLADPTKSMKLDLVLPAGRPEVNVRINAHQPVLLGGQSEQLVATVIGSSNRSVTWASSGLGNISPLGVYTAPAIVPPQGATVRIIATSNADPGRSAKEDITLRPAPASRYSGPQVGTVTWNGKIGKNQTLVISADSASMGSISGSFPGVPITVELTSKGGRIVSAPSSANGWRTIVIESQSNQKTMSVEWRVNLH